MMAAQNHPREAALQLMAEIHALEQSVTQQIQTPQVNLDSMEVEEVVVHGAYIYQKAQFNDTEPALVGYPYILKSTNAAYHCSSPLDLLEQAHSMATETLVLAKCQPHRHVRRLHAISSVKLTQLLSGQDNGNGNYFMVLDVMDETLQERLQRWRKHKVKNVESSSSGTNTMSFMIPSLSLFSSSSSSKQQSRQNKKHQTTIPIRRTTIMDPHAARDRCQTIGLDTARALAHLHQQDVVYGNVSPQTIGFHASSGVWVLSDFSHSSMMSLQDDDDNHDESPARQQQAQKAKAAHEDVYMFGWLLWDLTTLQIDTPRIRTAVNNSHVEATASLSLLLIQHPSLEPLQRLIHTCWNATRHQCPSFTRIVKRLMEATILLEQPSSTTTSFSSPSSSSSSLLLSPIQDPVETSITTTAATTSNKGRSSILPSFRFKSSSQTMSKIMNKKNSKKHIVVDEAHTNRSKARQPQRQSSGDTTCTQHSSSHTSNNTDTTIMTTLLSDMMDVRYGNSNSNSNNNDPS